MLSRTTMHDDTLFIEHITTPTYVFSPQKSDIDDNNSLKPYRFSTLKNFKPFSCSGQLDISPEKIFFFASNGITITSVPHHHKTPPKTKRWYSPFADPDRGSLAALKKRIVSSFGDYRSSIKKGHKHAGTDFKGAFNEPVFPIGNGLVLFASDRPFNSTVIIQHITPQNDTLYSKYVHVEKVRVKPGELVTPYDTLGRIFNKQEFVQSRFDHPHLHLEIRKIYRDKGKASSYSMTMKELEKYCIDPFLFFTETL
ncbi:MAG: M23 family metallopeptidase [Chitinispirillaceae bacterium]